MQKYNFTFLLILLAANLYASPLHTRLKHTMIIDTDCSLKNLRAVSILLSHPGNTVKAIIVSKGQVPAKEGYERISNLLTELMNLCKTEVTNISKAICSIMKVPLNPAEREENMSRLSEEVVALSLGNPELYVYDVWNEIFDLVIL